MPWTTPKTDWTADDYYNADDLDRVENNIGAVADIIETYSTRPSIASIVAGRTESSIEYYDSLNRIEGNIEILKDSIFEPPDWTTPKTDWVSVFDEFSYVDANRLESNLESLYNMANNISDGLLFCGTFNSGQGNTML